jgi:hypothetical protein
MSKLMKILRENNKLKLILGWIAVVISTAIASIWTIWGILETFHESWFLESIWQNILLMLRQYFLFAILFVLLTVVSIRLRRIGASIFFAAAILFGLIFRGASLPVMALIIPPLIILGLFYWFGRPAPRRYAYLTVIIVPLVIILALGIPKGIKVSQRLNDGDFGMRQVVGNGVELVWAPQGPGWPDHGISWDESNYICQYLTADGTTLEDTPQYIWRLPTAAEAVASMTRKGFNAGGTLNPETMTPRYETEPDKETPLWNPHTQIIYYCTADEMNEERAYLIAYNGEIRAENKRGLGSLACRAVKQSAE